MSRCTGHCCKDIGLSVSPEELRASYMRFIETQAGPLARRQLKAGAKPRHMLSDYSSETTTYEDIHLLFPMLTFTHQDERHPDMADEDLKLFKPSREEAPVYHYSCKHYDDANGNCTIYDIRPRMCSGFAADNQGCGYKGCTWSEAVKRREDWRAARQPCKEVSDDGDCEMMEKG